MAWWDFFKVWTYAFTDDPISRRRIRDLTGAAISQIDAIPDMRAGGDGSFGGGGGSIRLRDTNDFVDLSTVTNRIHRYKEYERLRNMAEIEMAMTVFADEACLAGHTKVATPHGYRTLKELAENEKDRFLIYCYDFEKQDYTLGWAFNARKTKTAKTIKIILDDGSDLVATPDHRVLMRNGQWKEVGQLEAGDELMPFYRIQARQDLTKIKTNQFPRIWTHNKGWIHERQLVDEYTSGQDSFEMKSVNKYCRMIAEGLSVRQMKKLTGNEFITMQHRLERAGFSNKELKWLGTKADRRRVIARWPHEEIDVYDLSVEKHKNFATDWGIVHNCQKDDEGKVMTIHVNNTSIKEELEYLMFHRKMLNFDQKKLWNISKQLFIYGDFFWEIVIDVESPKSGILNLVPLPPDSLYRIETTKGRLIEFQQSKEGPDFNSLARVDVTQATDADLQQATAIRFAPEQIVHMKIGDDRRTFYPYGVSLIEAARGPAHQLRLMEDAMVVYRLCLSGYSSVMTKFGRKWIKNIKVGDDVYSLDRHEGVVPSKVTYTANNGVQPVYRLASDHIEIIGTATHPVLVNRNGIIGMVDIKDIVAKHDKLINVTRKGGQAPQMPKVKEEHWSEWGYLSDGNSIDAQLVWEAKKTDMSYRDDFYLIEQIVAGKRPFPLSDVHKTCLALNLTFGFKQRQAGKNVPLANDLLPDEMTEEFARLFGFLLGDGSLRSRGNNAYTQFDFTCGVDESQNLFYANLLTKYFGRCHREKEKRNKIGDKYVVSSRAACSLLLRLGFRPGAKNKRIPNWAYTAPESIRIALVKGIADADAHIRNLPSGLWTAEFAMCNKELINGIKELWHSSGLCSGSIRERERVGGHNIEPNRKMKSSISHELYISEKQLQQYETVRSVTYAGEEEVYDFEVDRDEHNFIVNGTCTSNTRAPERRVFYIDVQQLPPYKAEAFIERMKDQFKKKKVPSRSGFQGASQVEERWHAPAADEDYWIPIRPNANTRVETLPGAQNLGEIDDTVYFRNKLFTALNFPKNYFNNEDTQSTRIALSAQDIKFARMIERLQAHMEDAFWDICDRHLRLLGYPEESYEDLTIKFTPPSDWRELTRAEVITNRLNNASNLKGSQLMSDYDILTKWLKYSEEESKKMLARLKIQKLEDLKLQIIAQNPTLLGVGLPGPNETEVGTEPGGPSPMLGGEMGGAPPGGPAGAPPAGGMPPPAAGGGAPPPMGMRKYMRKYMGEEGAQDPMGGGQPPAPGAGPPPEGGPQGPGAPPPANSGAMLPEPSQEDIKRFDLDIQDFAKEMDEPEFDASENE